jgi:predicted DNA-binding transcriptional regulator AlpA
MLRRTDLKHTPVQNRKLPTRALCERYGITTRTIDRWVEAGVLPQPFRINRARYWDEAELEAADRARMAAAEEGNHAA